MPQTLEKTVIELITARVPEVDLRQLGVDAKMIDETYTGAIKVVAAYGVDIEASKELTLKIAIYSLYLRATSGAPEHIVEDYKMSIKILNDLKNSAKIESSGSFSIKSKSSEKENLKGY